MPRAPEPPPRIARLKSQICGKVIVSTDPEYSEARRLFNGMIDRYPAVISQCCDTEDVRTSLRYALDSGLLISVRGGGHNVAGSAICDDGMVIDLSNMKGVIVDRHRRRILVRPGVRLGELDKEAQAFGLAVPVGIISDTGVAGLTLGGGLGWLMGRFGLTCDNLVGANVVLSDGSLVRAGVEEGADPDLLWALRGAGANFGIVTSFEFTAHPLEGVLAGSLLYSLHDAADALRHFSAIADAFPDELTCSPVLITQSDGSRVLSVDVCSCGSGDEAIRALAQLRDLGCHISDNIGRRSYVSWQRYLDDPARMGRRSYWKSINLPRLDDALIDLLVERFRTVPSLHTMLTFDHVHGAVGRVGAEDTAFGSREWTYSFLINSNWDDPVHDEVNVRWAQDLFREVTELSSGCGVYVNYLGTEGDARSRDAYAGTDYSRLRHLKRRYDPANIFRHNQNILPADE